MSDIAKDISKQDSAILPDIRVPRPKGKIDWSTILGLIFAIGLIVGAIVIGQSKANFFNAPAFAIVILGTMAATAVSYSASELRGAVHVIRKSFYSRSRDPDKVARSLMDLAVVAKKKGLLALSSFDDELRKEPFMRRTLLLAVDGYKPEDVERVVAKEIHALIQRHNRTASMARRASEVAPAMGLIGTLVGLVQMLADLENPETIGPSMAVALLTTFYGAILGTVVLAPLAAKLERNSRDEVMIRSLIGIAAASIARQQNPRQLEMLLNAELPPAHQIRYFD